MHQKSIIAYKQTVSLCVEQLSSSDVSDNKAAPDDDEEDEDEDEGDSLLRDL